MIRNESEYQEALRRHQGDREIADLQRKELAKRGLSAPEIETAMAPLLSFQAQLIEEISWYENVQRRNFDPARRLTELGRYLIALRIANRLTQKELAARLGVSEAQVSRDERNEYHGVTLSKAQRILDALGETITASVEPRPGLVQDPELARA